MRRNEKVRRVSVDQGRNAAEVEGKEGSASGGRSAEAAAEEAYKSESMPSAER